MAEAISAFSLTASILQVISFGSKVVATLKDFKSGINEFPKAFRDIKTELPLLLDTLKRTKEQADLGTISQETQDALLPVINGCRNQAELLDDMLTKVIPETNDSSWQRKRKAISSLGVEKKTQAITDTLRGYVQILTYYQAGSLTRLEKPSSPPQYIKPVFMVPFDRDTKYVDRKDITAELSTRLANQRRVALTGIGGAGKTQIAIEYCYQYHEHNPDAHVLWVHASTVPRLDQAYKSIARKLNLPAWDDLDLNTFEVVSDWLSEHGKWLLVLDNADDLNIFFAAPTCFGSPQVVPTKQMHEYIPRCEDGTILITTRDKRVGYRLADREEPILVSSMTIEEAEALLRSNTSYDQGLSQKHSEKTKLLEQLSYLPLAITQAAAFMFENSVSVSEYLEIFRTNESEIEEFISEDLGDHRRYSDTPSSVLNTLTLSLDQIVKQKPLATDLLSFMAYLDRQSIPRSLLKRENVRSVDFVSALGTLQAFSLINVEKGGASFGVHRLVQLSTQRWLKGSRLKWQEEVLRVMSEAFPMGDIDNWKECETLSPHAQTVIRYSGDINPLQRAKILHNLARFDDQQGRYALAEARFAEVAAIREELLGINHADTLKSLSYLGEVLFRENKYSEAEPMLRRVISELQKLLGSHDTETRLNIGHLAEVVQGHGRWAEAEQLYRQALEGREESLDDLTSLKIADNYGAVLRDQKRYDEAEKWITKSLLGREKLLGPRHFETLRSVNHLALLYTKMDRPKEAEELSRRVITGSEELAGRDHQQTLGGVYHLGTALRLQGLYAEAAEQYRRALDGFTKVLGLSNRMTLRCLQSLALVEEAQGGFAQAEILLTQVVQGMKLTLGPEHPHTIESIDHLKRVSLVREAQASAIS